MPWPLTRENALIGPAKVQIGGPGPRQYTIPADEYNFLVDTVLALTAASETLTAAVESVSGLLFELDPTVDTGLSPTTDVEAEYGAGAGAPVGTLAVTEDVAADWMASQKVLTLSTDGTFSGLLARRVLCGALPAEGYIVDLGIAGVSGGSLNYGVLLVGYQPGDAANKPTGLGIYFSEASSSADVMAVGDDGTAAPHTPSHVATGPSFGGSFPTALTSGPFRVVVEFKKLDAVNPAQWMMRIHAWGADSVDSALASGAAFPDGAYSTPLAIDGFSPSRIALGCWNQSVAAACTFEISHLRVYSLGSAIPV